jgi:cell division protein FtsI (penicillin-binding protein 3)
MHKLLPPKYMAETATFPLLKAGHMDDLRLVCNELGVSNHADESEEWVEANPREESVFWRTRTTNEGVVPDVRGMTLKDALFLLENRGLRVNHIGRGRVTSQTQLPGTKILQGSTIFLSLGAGT